ncbi:MAG TPA: hypothetical protein VFA80_05960 [Xanthobacteraceae bacterium]|jgi:hypothetical protein|nr:hypothetical protein [Xanthobacteraceae bacterium]
MKRISSSWTFFHKRVFPLIWFGFCAVFVVLPLLGIPISGRSPPGPFFLAPAVMILVGLVIMRKLIFDLVDQVWDDGDSLLVRNRGEEERVALADIKNVNYTPFLSPPRVVLSLRRTTTFGDQIAFCAPVRLVPFASSPVITDLINRVDAARRKSA